MERVYLTLTTQTKYETFSSASSGEHEVSDRRTVLGSLSFFFIFAIRLKGHFVLCPHSVPSKRLWRWNSVSAWFMAQSFEGRSKRLTQWMPMWDGGAWHGNYDGSNFVMAYIALWLLWPRGGLLLNGNAFVLQRSALDWLILFLPLLSTYVFESMCRSAWVVSGLNPKRTVSKDKRLVCFSPCVSFCPMALYKMVTFMSGKNLRPYTRPLKIHLEMGDNDNLFDIKVRISALTVPLIIYCDFRR